MTSLLAQVPGMSRTSAERQQRSRERRGYAYQRARNAAERQVMQIMRVDHPEAYEGIADAVDVEARPGRRSARWDRIRSGCAAWYRDAYRARWDVIFDRCIADATRDGQVVIKRRKTA